MGEGSGEDQNNCPRGHWRPAEDENLRQLVRQHGPRNWNAIAENIQGRSGKSCRLRWFNQLDPRINRNPFSKDEEQKLLGAQRIHGNKWSLISRLFPGRTDNAVKNHWHVLTARNQRENSRICTKRFHPNSESKSPTTCMFGTKNARLEENGGIFGDAESDQVSSLCWCIGSSSGCSNSKREFSMDDHQFETLETLKSNETVFHYAKCGSMINCEGDAEESTVHREDVRFIDFLGVGLN